MTAIAFVDSHTGGEPTRLVLEGGPALSGATMAELRADFAQRWDTYRSAIVGEPRGSEPMVGALLTEPCDPSCDFGVIYFNQTGMLGMCGHGTIGVFATLLELGRISPGTFRLDTPVGPVGVNVRPGGWVDFENVPSFRLSSQVEVVVDGIGPVVGDVAYGGNWFYLVSSHHPEIHLSDVQKWTDWTVAVRSELARQGHTGLDGAEIDHVELFGASATADSKNFVLCPGRAWDRSPCGTGTSAKVACLAADGALKPGQIWRQESTTGSVFEASYRLDGEERVIPKIAGQAFVTARGELLLRDDDPLQWGLRP